MTRLFHMFTFLYMDCQLSSRWGAAREEKNPVPFLFVFVFLFPLVCVGLLFSCGFVASMAKPGTSCIMSLNIWLSNGSKGMPSLGFFSLCTIYLTCVTGGESGYSWVDARLIHISMLPDFQTGRRSCLYI